MAPVLHEVTRTVVFLRTRLAALALIAAVLTATAAPLIAAQAHIVCAGQHHGCGRPATLVKCCCGGQDGASTRNTKVETTVQLQADLRPVPVPFATSFDPGRAQRIARPRAFPPGATPPDLLALLSTLLI